MSFNLLFLSSSLRLFIFLAAASLLNPVHPSTCWRELSASHFLPDSNDLKDERLGDLYQQVFGINVRDQKVTIIQDLPHNAEQGNADWQDRIATSVKWAAALSRLGAKPRLLFYRAVEANNGDLPEQAWDFEPSKKLPSHAGELEGKSVQLAAAILDGNTVFAPTEFSATAPLKGLAKGTHLRGVTLPGWNSRMIPALEVNFAEVKKRCSVLASKLSGAIGVEIQFATDGPTQYVQQKLYLDLRNRTPHVSNGAQEKAGDIGNLPSGETYIVPYEGEIAGQPSLSAGVLPVQFGSEVVLYRIENNRAVEILSKGPASEAEQAKLFSEPTYGNIAELGLGVLSDLGVKPVGEILLDEKLGLHIAFGRSEHLGGVTRPENFSSPQSVIHIDRIYLPETQPNIRVISVQLIRTDGSRETIMTNGAYLPELFSEP